MAGFTIAQNDAAQAPDLEAIAARADRFGAKALTIAFNSASFIGGLGLGVAASVGLKTIGVALLSTTALTPLAITLAACAATGATMGLARSYLQYRDAKKHGFTGSFWNDNTKSKILWSTGFALLGGGLGLAFSDQISEAVSSLYEHVFGPTLSDIPPTIFIPDDIQGALGGNDIAADISPFDNDVTTKPDVEQSITDNNVNEATANDAPVDITGNGVATFDAPPVMVQPETPTFPEAPMPPAMPTLDAPPQIFDAPPAMPADIMQAPPALNFEFQFPQEPALVAPQIDMPAPVMSLPTLEMPEMPEMTDMTGAPPEIDTEPPPPPPPSALETAFALASDSGASAMAQDTLERAMDGNAQAIKDMAYFLFNGFEGLEENTDLALELFNQAADMGNVQAQVDLAYIEYHGLAGVEANPEQALETMQDLADDDRRAARFVNCWNFD
jgi:hypothetical protein